MPNKKGATAAIRSILDAFNYNELNAKAGTEDYSRVLAFMQASTGGLSDEASAYVMQQFEKNRFDNFITRGRSYGDFKSKKYRTDGRTLEHQNLNGLK